MALTAIGLGLGLIATLALTRIITTLLYGVSPTDPLILVAISALLAVVAFLACSISARKAIKVDPVIALREE
jgi:putative ABC transport system permease protein